MCLFPRRREGKISLDPESKRAALQQGPINASAKIRERRLQTSHNKANAAAATGTSPSLLATGQINQSNNQGIIRHFIDAWL